MQKHQSAAAQAPYDILSAVFEEMEGPCGDIDFASRMPFILGSVCRRWRQVALSTPAIWTSLRVRLDAGQLQTDWSYVQEWLNRSGQRPLYICITTSSRNSSPNWTSLIALINGCSRRWYEITLHLPSPALSLFGGPQQQAPMLRYVDVRCTNQNIQQPLCLVAARPQIAIVSVCPFDMVSIAWSSLTYVEVFGLPLNRCLVLLQNAPLLRVSIFFDVRDPDGPLPPHFIHTALQTIKFCTYHGTDTGDMFFETLTLPRLEKLCFFAQQPGRLPDGSLRHLVERSACVLKELQFHGIESMVEGTFLQFLETTPELQRLEIYMDPCSHHYVAPNNLIRRLIDTSHLGVAQPFLPRLAHFGCLSREPIPWSTVLDLFGPHDKPGDPQYRPLKTVRMNFSLVFSDSPPGVDLFDENALQRISSLQAAGCELIIDCHPDDKSTLSTPDLIDQSRQRLANVRSSHAWTGILLIQICLNH